MTMPPNRRDFVKQSTRLVTGFGLAGLAAKPLWAAPEEADNRQPLFKISLTEWSLHRHLWARDGQEKLDHLDFPEMTRSLGMDAVEYLNHMFGGTDKKYLTELNKRCGDLGVKSLLIMCDGEGHLGEPDPKKRARVIENHYKWVEAARFLGCHSIRTNAHSRGSPEEQMRLAADGLRRLTEFGAQHDINVIVENHGGLTSDGKWLAAVIKKVDHPRCGTLPDFGNFCISREPEKWYDRYQGVSELMPLAKAVSAKSKDFDQEGNEIHTDYVKMMKIVLGAGYRGYVGIEYEGNDPDERTGILKTRKLLERVREKLSGQYA